MTIKENCTTTYDVMICYNSKDKQIVEDITKKLKKAGMSPWFDLWNIPPGRSFQHLIANSIQKCNSAAVFIGTNGLGPWQEMEIEAIIRKFVIRGCPVIPVILPTVLKEPKLPPFLSGMSKVDFRIDSPDPINQLIWGIRNDAISNKDDNIDIDDNIFQKRITFESELKMEEIRIKLNESFEKWNEKKQIIFANAISKLLDISEVVISKVRKGCVEISLKLSCKQADQLYSAIKNGNLKEFTVESIARQNPSGEFIFEMIQKKIDDKDLWRSRPTHGTGTVKWFNSKKGFGFITPDGCGEDLFVQHSEIRMKGFACLDEGQRIEFEISNNGKRITFVKPSEKK